MPGIGVRKQIQLIQISVAIDYTGRNIEEPGEVFNTWAEITNPSGFRDYDNGITQFGKTKKFLVRFRFDLSPNVDWKVKYEGKEWTISQINKVEEKKFYWQIIATSKSDV